LLAASESPPDDLLRGKPFVGVEWMRPASVIAVITAVAGFVASYNVGGGWIAGLLNPLFFVGLPLGIYWWRRSQSGFQCPHCGNRNSWSTINRRRFPAGKSVKCLICRRSFLVPSRV
jgi:hypothetical protein